MKMLIGLCVVAMVCFALSQVEAAQLYRERHVFGAHGSHHHVHHKHGKSCSGSVGVQMKRMRIRGACPPGGC